MTTYFTKCCDFQFFGMNHSPEFEEKCRNCGKDYEGQSTSFEKKGTEVAKKYSGVEIDVNKRWENGVDHHPESEKLMKKIAEIDFWLCDDYFGWKTGGDGDNGENLMYILDIILEHRDNEKQNSG